MTDEERCYASALRILSYRFNSEGEMRRKLAAKRFGREIVDRTIERLRGERWLDDARFAAAWVRKRSGEGVGRLRIRRELSAAGVDDETIGVVLGESGDAAAERERLAALCARRIGIIARRHGSGYLRSDAGRKKLLSYLLNQGYGAADAIEAVDGALKGKLKMEE
ncbi:MAG TPA: regulatory protein RecX [Thermoanaerobaculia bacterium]|nr:regulatory protein RecX [Thermoanaerobaculia bacterium]